VKQNTHLRRMFWDNLKRIKGSLLLAAFFMLAGAAVELLKPWPLKIILDHVIGGRKLPHRLEFVDQLGGGSTNLLLLCAGAIVAISLVGGMFSYLEVFITKAIGYRMVYTLRREVFAHLQRLSLSFHNRARTGDLLTTFAKDTSTLKDVFAEALLKFADHFLSVIGMMVILWMIDWRVAAIALASLPFLCFTLLHLYRQTKLSLKKQRKQEGKVTSRFNEVLAAVPLVQAFGRERHEEQRYEEVSNETLRESIRMTRLEAAASRSSQIMTAVGTAGTVLFGALEVQHGRMTAGDLVLVMSYLSSMYKPLRSLAKLSIDFSKAAASAERIAEVLEVEPEIQDRPDAIDITDLRGEIIFTAVSFDYGDGKEVLRHVSFEVRPGQKLALVGVSGAGKSTIASLILRLYEAQQGAILIDGIAIERLRRESLRKQIGIVLQQSVLFGATIRENIAYGKPSASLEEIVAAAKTANADEFIRELEDGYDSVIGERGATLSAGQRQRIAIARAIIRNPRILILDEPMTGLDAENENKVREALDRLMTGKTTIMITHDLQHMADADHVLVLKDGRIAERGTHAELLSRSGYYREVFDLGAPSAARHLARA
jgi:ATP-binding cassette subfamily B protein/subfamily B ATP-binding cassette protein MsbA